MNNHEFKSNYEILTYLLALLHLIILWNHFNISCCSTADTFVYLEKIINIFLHNWVLFWNSSDIKGAISPSWLELRVFWCIIWFELCCLLISRRFHEMQIYWYDKNFFRRSSLEAVWRIFQNFVLYLEQRVNAKLFLIVNQSNAIRRLVADNCCDLFNLFWLRLIFKTNFIWWSDSFKQMYHCLTTGTGKVGKKWKAFIYIREKLKSRTVLLCFLPALYTYISVCTYVYTFST